MKIIALEGPCCAGKTTLAMNLTSRLAPLRTYTLACFVDVAGGEAEMPLVPATSSRGELESLKFFLRVESKRRRILDALSDQPDVLILDRSVHTLAAHVLGTKSITGIDTYEQTVAIIRQYADAIWPTVGIYLHVEPTEVTRRSAARNGRTPDCFLSRQYIEAFRTHFEPTIRLGSAEFHFVDGSLSPTRIADDVAQFLLSGV